MNAERFDDAYAPAGAITLRHLQIHDEMGDTVRCLATLTVDHRDLHLETSAHGTIGAVSEMLYGLGFGVEIVGLYHQTDGAEVTAYLQCTRDGEQCWSYGRAANGDEATVHALIAAANQLTGRLPAAC